MGLFAQSHDLGKMLMINVCIDAEEALQNGFRYGLKVFGKRHANFRGEKRLIVQLILNPRHEIIDILWRTTFDWFLNRLPVCPMILVLWTCRHDAACVFCAKLGYRSIQHIDLIEKVYSYKRERWALIDIDG